MVTLNKENYSGRDRAKKLKMSLVEAILKKDKENESVRDRPRSGPPPSTTPREYRYVFIPLSKLLTGTVIMFESDVLAEFPL